MGEVWKDKQPALNPTSYFESLAVFNPSRSGNLLEADALDGFLYLNTHIREIAGRINGKPFDIFQTKYAAYCALNPTHDPPANTQQISDTFLRLRVTSGVGKTLVLEDMIKGYFEDGHSCDEGSRVTRLVTPPRVLVLALEADRPGTPISIPADLDLTQAVTSAARSFTYKLIGAIYREESAEGEQHFVADYFNTRHKAWIHTNDAKTFTIEGPPESSPIARMLFYVRSN